MKNLTKWLAFAVALLMAALMMGACDGEREPSETTTDGGAPQTPPADACVHQYGEWIVISQPTCTQKGLQSRACTLCRRSETGYLDFIPHDEIEHAAKKAENCTDVSWDAYVTCSRCDYSTYIEIAAVHNEANQDPNCPQCIEHWGNGLQLSFRLNEEQTGYTVTGIGSCKDTDIIIPTEYKGIPVTEIGNRAFYNCSFLTSITIPDSVTRIGNDAFSGCSSLVSITIPDGVTRIGDGAFRDCSSLTSVTIGDSVTSIGGSAFHNCGSLTSITIPDGVTSIGDSAFHNCSSLMSITIPDGVTRIGNYAFDYCSSLTSIYYGGTADDWANISIGSYNTDLTYYATRYYYSETEPTTTGNYWHYVDGIPTPW